MRRSPGLAPAAPRLALLLGITLLVATLVGASTAGAGDEDYDSRVTQFKVPTLVVGKKGKVEFRIENTGQFAWRGDEFALVVSVLTSPSGAKAQRDELELRKPFDKLPTVQPGGTLTHDETIEAPEHAGTWVLGCWLEHKGRKFGDTADARLVISSGKVSGRIVSKHGLSLLPPGEPLELTFSVLNDGDGPWEASDADRDRFHLVLECTDGPDGVDAKVVRDFHADVELSRAVPARQGLQVGVEVKSPPFTGPYEMVARLFHGDKPISDPYDFEAEVERTLKARFSSVKFDGDTKKASLEAGKRHQIAARVANDGKAAWNATKFIVLKVTVEKTEVGRKDDGVKAFASEQKLKSSRPVMPGGTCDFTWSVDAPKDAGRWILALSMYDLETKKPFGEIEKFEVTVP